MLIFPLVIILGSAIQILEEAYRDRTDAVQNGRKYLLLCAGVLGFVLVLQLILALMRPTDGEFQTFMASYFQAPGLSEHIFSTVFALGVVVTGLVALILLRQKRSWCYGSLGMTFWVFAAVWIMQIHGFPTESMDVGRPNTGN